jgi:hypothetical protein
MASSDAVMATLMMLAREYAGTVTQEKADIWLAALEDVPDAALPAAVAKVIKTHTGGFIPSVALVREAAGANGRPRIDVEDLRHRIYLIAGYNPHGFVPPRVEDVRRRLGDGVADAYGAVGGGRLFADETTGDIAMRDFAKECASIQSERGPGAFLPPAALEPKKLAGGS